jgi:hypothetical protein
MTMRPSGCTGFQARQQVTTELYGLLLPLYLFLAQGHLYFAAPWASSESSSSRMSSCKRRACSSLTRTRVNVAPRR